MLSLYNIVHTLHMQLHTFNCTWTMRHSVAVSYQLGFNCTYLNYTTIKSILQCCTLGNNGLKMPTRLWIIVRWPYRDSGLSRWPFTNATSICDQFPGGPCTQFRLSNAARATTTTSVTDTFHNSKSFFCEADRLKSRQSKPMTLELNGYALSRQHYSLWQ